MRVRAAIACAALLPFGGCWSAPELGAVRTPVQSLRRPLEPDLTTAAFAARGRRLSHVLDELTGEPGRAADLTAVPGRLLHTELTRSRELPGTATKLLGGEARRAARLADGTGMLWDRLLEPEGDDTHHVTATARLLGIDRAPMGEISDRRHRTDPADDRPELSLWQRLVRRLRL